MISDYFEPSNVYCFKPIRKWLVLFGNENKFKCTNKKTSVLKIDFNPYSTCAFKFVCLYFYSGAINISRNVNYMGHYVSWVC